MGRFGGDHHICWWRVHTRRLGYMELVQSVAGVFAAGLMCHLYMLASELDSSTGNDGDFAARDLVVQLIFSREAQLLLAPLVPAPLAWTLVGLGMLIAILQLLAGVSLIISTRPEVEPLDAYGLAGFWWLATIMSTWLLGTGGILFGSVTMLRLTLLSVAYRALGLYIVRQFMSQLDAWETESSGKGNKLADNVSKV